MRVMGLDPGAKRLGWAVVEGDGSSTPVAIGSGVIGLELEQGEKWQAYKLRLIQYIIREARRLLNTFNPDEVVNETLPSVGFNNLTQVQLALAAITSFQVMAYEMGYPVSQVAAVTMKTRIAGNKRATKVKLRNAIFKLVPKLAEKKWVADETDAYAAALTRLGYDTRTDNGSEKGKAKNRKNT